MGNDLLKVTYLGTTMLLFDDGKDQILFDCHVTRPSMRTCIKGQLSTNKAVANQVIDDFKIDRLRGIFVSHSHHDHVMDAPYFATTCNCKIYGSDSTKNIALGNGVLEEDIFSYSERKEYQIGDFKIKILPSIHSTPHWYNDDIGMTIDEPFTMPAPKSAFKEGGSVDFFIEYKERTYLIRPSYNFIVGQLDDIKADVLFLGIAGLSKDSNERIVQFFAETIAKVKPEIVIPIHWDHFFKPLYGDVRVIPLKLENTGRAMRILANYCTKQKISCAVQIPMSSFYV